MSLKFGSPRGTQPFKPLCNKALYKGSFLAKSESPLLTTWRNCFDARLSHLIYQMQDIDQLSRIISRVPDRIDAIQRLSELLPKDSHQRNFFLNLI